MKIKNQFENIKNIYVLVISLLFISYNSSSTQETNDIKENKVQLIELVNNKFKFDSMFFELKQKDTNRYLLFLGYVKNKTKIDTAFIIAKNDKFGQSLEINKYYNLKICKFQKCLKLFYDNLTFFDINSEHLLSDTEKISVGWLSIFKSNTSKYKNYTYYVAEDW